MADALLDGVIHIEGLHKVGNGLCRHFLVGAGKLLECLIRVGVSHRTENGLDGFGHNCPVVFQVVVDSLLIEKKFANTLFQGGEGDERVGNGHTDVAGDGGVGEVAL